MHEQDYKIPKREVTVEILFDDNSGKFQPYVLFLNEFSEYRKGEETVEEFLKRNVDFIPVKEPGTGNTSIINKEEIICLNEARSIDMQSPQTATLILRNRFKLQVAHIVELPEFRSRVQDYLNNDLQFLIFGFKGTKLYVNKSKISRITFP